MPNDHSRICISSTSACDKRSIETSEGSDSEDNQHESKVQPIRPPIKESDFYDASGIKRTLHGVIYQYKLTMFVAKRCRDKYYKFKMAAEMNAAESFDDIVLWYKVPRIRTDSDDKNVFNDTEYSIFLQSKHIQDEKNTKITENKLLTNSNDCFNLQQYFESYLKIKERQLGQNMQFVIATNIGFDFNDFDELSSLHFEEIPDAEQNILFKFPKGSHYRFVSADHEKRSVVKDKLIEVFQKNSQFTQLAKLLAEHIVTGNTINCVGLFKKYYNAVTTFIIDTERKKLKTCFINDQLPDKYKQFRHKLKLSIDDFLESLHKKNRTQRENEFFDRIGLGPPAKKSKSSNQSFDVFWTYLNGVQINMSVGFKNKFCLSHDPKVENSQELAKELGNLIQKKFSNKKNDKINVQIVQNGTTQKEIINKQLKELAGHVFVKNDKDEIIFSERFLNGTELKDTIQGLRDELLKRFSHKPEKEVINELNQVSFSIAKFETCRESEYKDLLKLEPHFPPAEIHDQDVNEFMNNLIFAVDLPNEQKLSKIMSAEFEQKFHLINADWVTSDFEHKIVDWLKTKQGIYLYDDKIDEFFEDMSKTIANLVLTGPTIMCMKKLQKYKDIEFNDENFKEQIDQFIGDENTTKSLLNIIEQNNFTLLGSLKVKQYIKHMRQGSFIFLKNSALLFLDTYVLEAFSNRSCEIIIIECNNSCINRDLFKGFIKLLEDKKNSKKMILISNRNDKLAESFKARFENYQIHRYQEIKQNIRFNHFNIATQQMMLNKIINFQGTNIFLHELIQIDSHLTNLLPLMDLVKGHPLTVGSNIPIFAGYDADYFIKRTFITYVQVNQTTLSYETKDELFPAQLQQILKDNDETKKLLYSEKNPENLTWKESFTNIVKLKNKLNAKPELQIKLQCRYSPDEFDKFLEQVQVQRTVLIADSAGTGKSTILTYVSQQLKQKFPSHWVVRIDLLDHEETLLEESNKKFNPIDLLINGLMNLKTDFEKHLFRQFLSSQRVILLFDAFDEISPDYENLVGDLIHTLITRTNEIDIHQCWIASRPHLNKITIEKLNSETCTLQPFTKTNQKDFLTKFWMKKLSLRNDSEARVTTFAESFISKFSSFTDDKEKLFMGIPLQAHMIAELFITDVTDFVTSDLIEPHLSETMNLLDLYDQFIEKKIRDIFQIVKAKLSIANQANKTMRQDNSKKIFKNHENLAVKYLLSEDALHELFTTGEVISLNEPLDELSKTDKDEILRVGIVMMINEKPKFMHRSFAEYFFASFLVKNLDNKNVLNFVVNKVLKENRFKVIRSFINHAFLKKLNNNPEYKLKLGDVLVRKKVISQAVLENNIQILQIVLQSIKESKNTRKLAILNNNLAPFQLAASRGSQKIFKILLNFYDDTTKPIIINDFVLNKNTEGSSLLQKAAINKRTEFVKWFLQIFINNALMQQNSKDLYQKFVESDREGILQAYKCAVESNDSELKDTLIDIINQVNPSLVCQLNLEEIFTYDNFCSCQLQ